MTRRTLADYTDTLRIIDDIEKEIRSTGNQELITALTERQKIANEKRLQIEVWLRHIPSRMQRIVTYRHFERMSWIDIGDRMDYGTPDSIRKEYERFLNTLN